MMCGVWCMCVCVCMCGEFVCRVCECVMYVNVLYVSCVCRVCVCECVVYVIVLYVCRVCVSCMCM